MFVVDSYIYLPIKIKIKILFGGVLLRGSLEILFARKQQQSLIIETIYKLPSCGHENKKN